MPAGEQRAVPGVTPGAPGSARMAGVEAPPRGPVYGSRFAIAAEHPAASLAGMNTLQRGGNAIDAAIAASAVNVVVKPYATHLGGDAFALVWQRSSNTVECLNAGGRASHKATLDAFSGGIPARGARASTVPGLVDAWSELHARHGSRPFAQLLQPAIELAERGFPVSLHLATLMSALAANSASTPDAEIRKQFLQSDGRPYRPGAMFRQPELAATLGAIAGDGRDGFYSGATGRAICEAMESAAGLIDAEDLAEPAAHWHDAIATNYRGCTVYEQALPSQGLIVLEALNIVEQFPLSEWGLTSPDAAHVLLEAIKLAFADARRYAADPQVERVPIERLLSKEHARARAAEIDLSRAKQHVAASAGSDTTSFVVADEDTAVCFIQSIFQPWGSGFAVPGTGVLMNNRMLRFSTDPHHPNHLAPGKRTVHTLNNFLVVRDGQLVIGGGTPGADYQVQCNLQSIVAAVDWGLDLHSAISAPRWGIGADGIVAMEGRFPEALSRELETRGHLVQRVASWELAMSRSQVLASGSNNQGWAAASDLRSEGLALAT
jgi:gamma-glutamyltranspeptidase/glutathione hydrolase